ncbi:hypothetical protein TanjilG_07713 [Lupinus angustifolius]|uniref:Uncharacterized protein n=1 Tax=Lupinus angustifolius TaxID=3871 RepID=A0A4P1RC59_LUPAN|nr:hypothetical protein TanjilG_07713 [Lupinus angustifolius]
MEACSTFHPKPQPCPWRPTLFNPKPISHYRISCSNNNNNNIPRWDSNAETSSPRNFSFNNFKAKRPPQQDQQEEFGKKRRWWSDEAESPSFEEETSGGWEEVIDSLWIFKASLEQSSKSNAPGQHCLG